MLLNTVEYNEPIRNTERNVWAMFLRLMNVNNGINAITDKQIKVYSYILSKEEGISWFSKPYVDEVIKNVEPLTYSEIMKLKGQLVKLGLVKEIPNPDDARKKLFLPPKSIRDLQKYVKKHKFVSFYYPIQIDGNTTE